MKYLTTFLLLFFCSNIYSEITIKGRINNYDGKTKVFYHRTIDGLMPAYISPLEVLPNLKGDFIIQYTNSGYGMVKINFSGIQFSFLHSDHSNITFEIDQEKIKLPERNEVNNNRYDNIRHSVKQKAIQTIDGDLKDVNRYYNKSIRSTMFAFVVDGCDYCFLIRDSHTIDKAQFLIDSLKQIEVSQLNSVNLQKGLENNSDLDLYIRSQIDAFYGSVFLNGLMMKRVEQAKLLIEIPKAIRTIYNRKWEELIERFLLEKASKITQTANSFEYNEFVLTLSYILSDYQKYNFEPKNESDDEFILERLSQNRFPLDSIFDLSKEVIFAYKLHNLSRFLHTETYYSPVLLYAVNQLKLEFPNSQNLDQFESEINQLKAYVKSSAKKFDKAIILRNEFVKFSDLIDFFPKKNILIDVWATWCGPCVEDFNYKSTIRPFIEDGELIVVYISIDKRSSEKKWMENIRYNQLEGYHILANDLLVDDMWNFLGNRVGLIPRYVIINKQGLIEFNNAARPSEGKLLFSQIEELISKKN